MDFETAVAKVLVLTISPSNEEKLKIYGLYKQGCVGDMPDDYAQPGIFNFAARAKYFAWIENKGKLMLAAKNEYILLVQELIVKYGITE